MNSITLIGLLAGFCTTISFLPQAAKTWRSKSAKDISLGMYSIMCAGVVLWLIYGFLMKDLPILLTNGVTLILACSILYFKLSFKN
ncbi:MAG TPA: SemiSWEET transporter [Balneolaceae bacterium]|nr:SemiSWEET transporter [Balneolaceae bacterium]